MHEDKDMPFIKKKGALTNKFGLHFLKLMSCRDLVTVGEENKVQEYVVDPKV